MLFQNSVYCLGGNKGKMFFNLLILHFLFQILDLNL